MQKLVTLLMALTLAVAPRVVAAAYSTEAMMSLQKEEGTFKVVVRVSRLLEQEGQITEQLIAEPKIQTAPGVPATLYSGLQPSNPNYANEENVTVDVSWPYPNESGTAFCAVTIRRGDEIVSKSKSQLKIEGPGRTPLIVAARDVDPKSVRVVDVKSNPYILLEFAGKTKEVVKHMAIENYGNKVRIRDSQGRLTDGGLSFGTYNEIGMALECRNEDEAKHIASLLRREHTK
jgi:hypothetical protein